MELKIYNPTEDGFVKKITWNHKEIKAEVEAKMKEYASAVYSENQIKEAKADRAKLNKFVQALESKCKEIKKQCMQPYEDFEVKMKEITAIVNESIKAIDEQVKGYEEQKKAEKLEKLKEHFYNIPVIAGFENLEFDRIFNSKWLNASVSLKKATEEIDTTVEEIKSNMDMLSNLPEYGFEAVQVYKTTLDVKKAISEAQAMAQMQKEKAEYERKLAEEKEKKYKVKTSEEDAAILASEQIKPVAIEEVAGQTSFTAPQSFDNYVEDFKTQPDAEREWIKFQAYMTVEDALALKKFFQARNIDFKAVQFDKEKAIEIMTDILSYAYCNNCGSQGECDECHRKYQNWSLSEGTADFIADNIIAECL